MVLWIIGMSGSGKTVLGKYIHSELKKENRNIVFFDGDIFRQIMGDDLGHSLEDRKKNADRITRLCKYLDEEGVDVIFSVLSIFHDSQEWNRANIKDYYEVYIETRIEDLIKRDAKGIYKRAFAGEIKNVVGVDIHFPVPIRPDMVIKNNGKIDDLFIAGQEIIRQVKPFLRKRN